MAALLCARSDTKNDGANHSTNNKRHRDTYSLKDQQLQLPALRRIDEILVDDREQGLALLGTVKVRRASRDPALQQATRSKVVSRARAHISIFGESWGAWQSMSEEREEPRPRAWART